MENTKMKHIEINIWKACNCKCVFCMSNSSGANMIRLAEFDYIKERLTEYIKEWYNSVWFLGWDISIHPRIIDIISLSKELWFRDINIITNWILFHKEDFARKIVEAWATRVNISIHSHLSEVEDKITQIPWWLLKKMKAIDNFNAIYKEWLLKSAISINIVVSRMNIASITDSLLYFYSNKWIRDIRINFVWLMDTIKLRDNWETVTITYTELITYLKNIIYISIKYKLRITFDTIPACIFYKISKASWKNLVNKFLWEQFDHIDQIEHVNVIDADENFKWKDKKKNTLKAKFETCNKCLYNYTCEWVWSEYKMIYWGDEFEPVLKIEE